MRYCGRCGAELAARTDAEGKEGWRWPGCGRDWIGAPHPVVLVLGVAHDGRVLFTRGHSWPEGYWGLVAGFVERGETAEAAAVREVLEETGLHVRVQDLLLDEPGSPGGSYQRRKIYRCQVVEGAAQPGYELEGAWATAYSFTEVGWFDLRQPTTWNGLIVADPITYPMLQRIRAALGY